MGALYSLVQNSLPTTYDPCLHAWNWSASGLGWVGLGLEVVWVEFGWLGFGVGR